MKVWRSKSGGSDVTRPSIIGTRHLGHGLPLISSAVAYEASMVPLRLGQISAAAQYCSVTAIGSATCSRKCPARRALGSRAGLRKLVVSVSVPCQCYTHPIQRCGGELSGQSCSSGGRTPLGVLEPFRVPRLGQTCRHSRRPIQKWRGAAATTNIAARKRT
jgi:hypothetical protein